MEKEEKPWCAVCLSSSQVCLNVRRNGENPFEILSCDHSFCTSCILHLHLNENYTCPLCRKRSGSGETKPNYLATELIEELRTKTAEVSQLERHLLLTQSAIQVLCSKFGKIQEEKLESGLRCKNKRKVLEEPYKISNSDKLKRFTTQQYISEKYPFDSLDT